jgi:hypothetical protein
MSKANITKEEKLPGGRLRLHFETDSGTMVYEYGKVNAAGYHKGQDPAELHGRMVEHKKKEK